MTEPASPHRERFVLLDGIRGIAAIFIVQRHAPEIFGKALPSSYLGVDLFFALSGFVLAHAYGQALRDGTISPLAFMKARVLRLYPLYAIALTLVIAYYMTAHELGHDVSMGELTVGIVTGILFIPSPITLSFNAALFLVHPAWSLFDELVANLAYALKGARAGVKPILVVIGISAVVLIVAGIEFGRLHAGFRWNEMYAGLGRVFFSFSAGILIYRFRRKTTVVRPWVSLACLAVVIAVLAAPTPKDLKAVFDIPVIFFIWPALLYVASASIPSPRVATVSNVLGTASYALYVLHTPLMDWFELLWDMVTDRPIGLAIGGLLVFAMVALSWFLTISVDQPLQKRLKHLIRRKRPAFS
jgi:peptidoglycan/LPS O-acetylase OafA/YrhL